MMSEIKPTRVGGNMPKRIRDIAEKCREEIANYCLEILPLLRNSATGEFLPTKEMMWAIDRILMLTVSKPVQSIELTQKMDDEMMRDPANMSAEQLQMLVSNKALQFITSMYESGQLQTVVTKLDSGWRPPSLEDRREEREEERRKEKQKRKEKEVG